MDYFKLLYAAEVRKLAVQMRTEARAAFYSGAEKMPETDDSAEALADLQRAWEDKFPVEYFVVKAVRAINQIANLIDESSPH